MKDLVIKIGGVELTVKQSFRSLMQFEEMTGRSVYQMNESLNDIMKLFYCMLSANNRTTFTYTFDEFINLIDDNPESIEAFTKYIKGETKEEAKAPVKKKVIK